MTTEEVLLIIRKAYERDKTICTERGRYAKRDLAICLTFMYYSHLKVVDTLKLTPESVKGEHHYFYSDKFKSLMEFEMSKSIDFYMDLQFFLYQWKRDKGPYLIKNKRRALITAFNQILLENNIECCKMTDVYRIGLVDNADVRRPFKVKREEIEDGGICGAIDRKE